MGFNSGFKGLRNNLQTWPPHSNFRSILLYEIFVIMQLQVDLWVILEYYTASLHQRHVFFNIT